MEYAIVENGVVTNVVVSESALFANWIDITDETDVGIGSLYDNGVFTKPPQIVNVDLTNFVIESNGTPLPVKNGEFWIEVNSPLAMAADLESDDIFTVLETIELTSGRLVNFGIIAEKVIKIDATENEYDVVEDVRIAGLITDKEMTITSTDGFSVSGKYRITEERMNIGLAELNADFRVTMEPIVFEVLAV